jgi:hypothetical protein
MLRATEGSAGFTISNNKMRRQNMNTRVVISGGTIADPLLSLGSSKQSNHWLNQLGYPLL